MQLVVPLHHAQSNSKISNKNTATGRRLSSMTSGFNLCQVRRSMDGIFGPSVHAKRLESISKAVVELMTASVLAIHAIGQAYAQLAQHSKNANALAVSSGVVLVRSHSEYVSRLV